MTEKTLRPKVLSCVVCDPETIEKMIDNGFDPEDHKIKVVLVPHQNHAILMMQSLFEIDWLADKIQDFETKERNKRIQGSSAENVSSTEQRSDYAGTNVYQQADDQGREDGRF